MTSKWSRHLGAAISAAALLTASAGLVASWGQEPGTARRPTAKADGAQPSPDDQVEALVREFDDAMASLLRGSLDFAKDREKIRAGAARFAKLRQDFSKRFLDLAGRHPRTNAAEQALAWLVAHDTPLAPSPEAERAREILTRDHVRSDRIKAVLAETSSSTQWASPATEGLLRRVLERSPYYEVRGLACYRLAELLIERAERVRIWQLLGSPPRSDHRLIRGSPESFALLKESDPRRLEDEAALLLERVVAEFPRVVENHSGDNRLGTFLEGPAKTEVDRLRRLSIGRPAPEIVGVDLDGKPMKLSEYRGKVVVLYFTPYFSRFGNRAPSLIADRFRRLGASLAGKPFSIAGVATWQLDEFRKEFRANGLPVRFWADQATPNQIVGPIHSAWDTRENSGDTYYVLDPRGTIRYNLPGDPALIEKAVTKLLEEQAPAGRGG